MKKLVSVIIPTYGRAELLDTAINSVLEQSYQDIEIIVVDDNPVDSQERFFTEKIMEKYDSVDRVKYCKHQINKGGCAARNTGIRNAKGEYIAFLDDDDRYLPLYIEKMVERLEETSSNMVYMSRAYCDNGKRIYTSVLSEEGYPEGHIFEAVLKGECMISIFFMASKMILERDGLFDEKLKGYQDCDIWFKLTRNENVAAMKDAEAIFVRDDRQRITINPYKREKDLEIFIQKWEKELKDEERLWFREFVLFNKEQIAINRIIWDITKSKDDRSITLKECLEMNISKTMKLKLILTKMLGTKGRKFYDWLRFLIKRNNFLFLDE